ncbi:MAG: hypothetical protein EHM35_01975 [Planctomycetaceae bacterium]|nr:MAG: hypothetical protein EHM35_01975 [Planctomycetaceae bacterium]
MKVMTAALAAVAFLTWTIAAHAQQCGGAKVVYDSTIDSPGEAWRVPGERPKIILNPALLSLETETVRRFVFAHECGHIRNNSSNELAADCWAVRQGKREGWLNERNLDEVCASFDDAPASESHPSGRARCANLDRCFNR